MKTVEDLTELNKIKLNQLFKYINNYIFQAIRSKKHFYCFDNKKNIGCNLYKIGRACSLHHMAGINNIARIKKYGDIKEIKRA